MKTFFIGLVALVLMAGLIGAEKKRFPPRDDREREREREREVYRHDIVGRVERVRVERDGDVSVWLRRTNDSGRPLEGREFAKEVEFKAHEAHCWIFHDRGMKEVSVKLCSGKIMNVQWKTIRGRQILELNEMRRPSR